MNLGALQSNAMCMGAGWRLVACLMITVPLLLPFAIQKLPYPSGLVTPAVSSRAGTTTATAANGATGHCNSSIVLRLDPLYGDGMVVQHHHPCFTGVANGPVVVVVVGQEVQQPLVRTDPRPDSCRFSACLPAVAASTAPVDLQVSVGSVTRRLHGIRFGDVFYCTGQSNMGLPLVLNKTLRLPVERTMAARTRTFLQARPEVHLMVQDLWRPRYVTKWRRATEASADGFSSVCWFFAVSLYQWHQDRGRVMPIGLIAAAYPAVPLHCWLKSAKEAAKCIPKVPIYNSSDIPENSRTRQCESLHGAAGCQRCLQDRRIFASWRGPAFLYNRGAPRDLARFPLRAVLFYQGESNSGFSRSYACQMQRVVMQIVREREGANAVAVIITLVAGREAAHGTLPFLWAAQLKAVRALSTKGNVTIGFATAHDLGLPHNIHPPWKMEVGRRLALTLRSVVYRDHSAVHLGPLVATITQTALKGNHASVVVTFTHVGNSEGLLLHGTANCTKCCAAPCFEVAYGTAPAPWRPISAPEVINATAVLLHVPVAGALVPRWLRFQFQDFPQCGLYNRQGLPVLPFRHSVPYAAHTPPALLV
eukprot:GGOE01015067.1.p1 GENE.GGOE01015067.1~~GGOE01015067.1.p1  ORF type:complete len:591 (-),score=81.61 GGOE01015067.1:56-1828(-)